MRKACLVLLFLIIGFLFFTSQIFAQHACPAAGFEDCGYFTCYDALQTQVKQFCCPDCSSPQQCYTSPACPGPYTPECDTVAQCSYPSCPGGSCAEMACINHQCISECVPCEPPEPGVEPTCTGMNAPSCINTGGTFTVSALGVQNATSVKFPTWDTQDGQEDIVWYNGSQSGSTWSVTINQSAHPKGNIAVHVYMFNADHTNVWCDGRNGIPLCPPPTCSVSLSSSSVEYPNSVVATVTGNANRAGSTPIRLWVERQDSTRITPPPGTEYYQAYTGKYYYQRGECTSSNFAQCSASFSVSLPVGSYYFHCDEPNDPSKCSGNPFCPYEGCTSNCADCTGWVSCSNNDNKTFNVTAPGPWFQTKDGDVHSGGDIRSKILSTASQTYFSLNGSGGYPGVVSYNGSSANFGQGSVSAPPAEWLAKTSFSKRSYDYFYSLLGSPTLETPPPEIKNEDLPSTDQVKAFSGDVQTGNEWQLGTKRIAIITNGKFLIKHRIVIDSGGSLVVIAQGGIGISKNLIAAGTGGNRLQGIFITDGTFYTSVDENFNFDQAESNKILVIDGGVIAGGVNLKRDFSGSLEYDNQTTPAETFRYDPSLFMNIHPDLWKSAFTWEELAP